MTDQDVIKAFNNGYGMWLISYVEDNKIYESLIHAGSIEGAIKAFRYDASKNCRILECINWNIREAILEQQNENT